MAHQYAITRTRQAVPRELPTMRDPDRLVYFREEVGGLIVGVIENLVGTYVGFIGTELKLTVALARLGASIRGRMQAA